MPYRKMWSVWIFNLIMVSWISVTVNSIELETAQNSTLVNTPKPSVIESSSSSPISTDKTETSRRYRRQDAGGGSTSAIGSRVKREAGSADWEEAKFGAFAPPPPASRRGNSRRRRSLSSLFPSFSLKKFFYFGRTGPPYRNEYDHGSSSPHKKEYSWSFGDPTNFDDVDNDSPSTPFITRTSTQRRFDVINRNFLEAENYLLSSTIQGNNLLRESFLINPSGVNCPELCQGPQDDTVGFALLGLCTPNYCNCDLIPFDSFDDQTQQCPSSDLVFDPISLSCKTAEETVLCSELFIRPLFDQRDQMDHGDFDQNLGQDIGWEGPTSDGDEWAGSSGWSEKRR